MLKSIGLIIIALIAQSCLAADNVRLSRYSTIAPIPTIEQLDPLSVIVQLRFPNNVKTIDDAVQLLLQQSGYALSPKGIPERAAVLRSPLPAVFRSVGPIRLDKLLESLAGQWWVLVEDPVHRMVDLQLDPRIQKQYTTPSFTQQFAAKGKPLKTQLAAQSKTAQPHPKTATTHSLKKRILNVGKRYGWTIKWSVSSCKDIRIKPSYKVNTSLAEDLQFIVDPLPIDLSLIQHNKRINVMPSTQFNQWIATHQDTCL